ncbi:MAG: hypothetical protein JNL42_08490 [Anaerolineae bacterium]|nr:hypothetical protein [Anaerolineae bacterium]
MTEYIAFNPQAEVRGRAILGMKRAMGERVDDLLKEHQLVDIQPDGWYRQQRWLDVLREIAQADMNSVFDFIAIAKEISRSIPLPQGIDSLESVLLRESEIYKANNRNCPGYIASKVVAPNHIEVTVHNPYPHDMMYGIIWGMSTRFEPHAVVAYRDNAPCSADAETCIYDVTW